MNKTEFIDNVHRLISEFTVQELKTDEYCDALEDIIYYLEDEITNTRKWIYENPELKLNLLESEGYLRGLLFVKHLINTYDCSEKFYKEMRHETNC